ncbi:hypothetical protein H9Q69_001069 [Fusarium xylarioides]|uniref:Uncharacterized protein n=1 Tax=Fusarium xylarioides TaxID=221167 RepID=A0A9P7L033_9HYPO|nr:hypothetical protein H9Q70_007105 [Fusarium xylarioides]KAG5759007.1 hypothetical protein H9Q72_012857 [Fusarium xylarioides]KAG5784181.1 hypothetical protein H9Q73_002166 [Fusarium xylarioides]KAG5799975.1 hypothetical protein H9Q69_001069 [Fusarium xylarioides]
MNNNPIDPTIPGGVGSLPAPFDQIQSHLGEAIVSAVDHALSTTLDTKLQAMRTELTNNLTDAINVAVHDALKGPLEEWLKDRQSMEFRLRNLEAAHRN